MMFGMMSGRAVAIENRVFSLAVLAMTRSTKGCRKGRNDLASGTPRSGLLRQSFNDELRGTIGMKNRGFGGNHAACDNMALVVHFKIGVEAIPLESGALESRRAEWRRRAGLRSRRKKFSRRLISFAIRSVQQHSHTAFAHLANLMRIQCADSFFDVCQSVEYHLFLWCEIGKSAPWSRKATCKSELPVRVYADTLDFDIG